MPLKTYDSQEAIPETLRASALELKDGKFAVEEPSDELGEKGKAAIERERENAKIEKKRADDAEAKAQKLEREAKAREKGVSEDELQRIRDEEEKARKPIIEERDRLAAENRKLKLTDRVQKLALEHGVLPDRIEDAMALLASRTDLGDNDGIIVKDKAGNVTAEKIEKFLSETFKTEKPWLYAGSGGSGSGGSGSNGRSGDAAPKPGEKGARAAEHRAAVSSAL